MNPSLTVVLPCYNDGAYAVESVAEVRRVLRHWLGEWEILVVDDCSTDGSAAAVRGLVEHVGDPSIRALFHERNEGRGQTVMDGFEAARGEIVGYIDIDLEVNAWAVLACADAVAGGRDAAVVRRTYKLSPRLVHRYVLSRGYSWLVERMLHLGLRDTEAGCKFFRREKVLPIMAWTQDRRWFWDTEIMAMSLQRGLTVAEVPWLYQRRPGKPSTVSSLRDSWAYGRAILRHRRRLRLDPRAAGGSMGLPGSARTR